MALNLRVIGHRKINQQNRQNVDQWNDRHRGNLSVDALKLHVTDELSVLEKDMLVTS